MKPNERLKLAREAAGHHSARSAALANGWAVSSYGDHERGCGGMSRETIARYAAAYHVTEPWLAYGIGRGPKKK